MDDRITFAGHEVLMSFGLLQELARIVDHPGRLELLDTDTEMQEDIIRAVVAKRTSMGKVLEAPNLDKLEFTLEEVEALFGWIQGHVLDLFLRRRKSTLEVISSRKDKVKDLEQYMTGLLKEVSPSPSSGP